MPCEVLVHRGETTFTPEELPEAISSGRIELKFTCPYCSDQQFAYYEDEIPAQSTHECTECGEEVDVTEDSTVSLHDLETVEDTFASMYAVKSYGQKQSSFVIRHLMSLKDKYFLRHFLVSALFALGLTAYWVLYAVPNGLLETQTHQIISVVGGVFVVLYFTVPFILKRPFIWLFLKLHRESGISATQLVKYKDIYTHHRYN